MRQPVYDTRISADTLTDPSAFAFLATQMNLAAQNGNISLGAPSVRDLAEVITDITEETTAQGASVLVVTISDPQLVLTTRWSDAPAFIDVDDSGLLIPIDVNYPDGTGRWWTLMAAEPSNDLTSANLKLTFEDRIVVQLRDMGGSKTAGNNQTRAQFIKSCVTQVPGLVFYCPALAQPPGSVAGDVTQATLLAMKNAANNVPSAADPNAPPARRNATKSPGIGAKQGVRSTPGGWRYTKPINGVSALTLSVLNPPTNLPDNVRNS